MYAFACLKELSRERSLGLFRRSPPPSGRLVVPPPQPPPPLPLQRALSCALAALAPICARAFLLTARSCVQVRAALLPRAKEYGAKMDGCV